jgi:hypothetical protein
MGNRIDRIKAIRHAELGVSANKTPVGAVCDVRCWNITCYQRGAKEEMLTCYETKA